MNEQHNIINAEALYPQKSKCESCAGQSNNIDVINGQADHGELDRGVAGSVAPVTCRHRP